MQTTAFEDVMIFLEILLDSVGIVAATQRLKKFNSLKIEDPTLLGPSNYRMAKLMEKDENQLDWYFSVLVQGAYEKEKATQEARSMKL